MKTKNKPTISAEVLHFDEYNVRIDKVTYDEDGEGIQGLYSSDLYDRVYDDTSSKYI